ncbi:RNase A-like domain-containing protein [Streptomyces sp. NPDC051636]|uniref:RNase A-like domain-containing protein n=1 Tax=Streptomyces sp. NPDC051636 TaxID=3365663 RepID=UPI003790C22F
MGSRLMGTPPPQGGTIDVKPSDLHRVAGGFAGEQTQFDKAARNLLTQLHTYPDAGGYGTAAQGLASAYVEVGNRYLEVWARSVVSIGGAAVGFATTANHYARAEAANDPSGRTQAHVQPPPAVVDKPPHYGSVPNLKWGDDDGGDDFIRSLLEHIPDVVWHVLRPLLEHAFRWGKVAEVYPFPQQHYLNSLSQDWADMTMSLGTTEGNLTGLVSGITQQTNSEWYDAMRQFCSSLWGTTAWGKRTGNYEWGHDSASSPTATHPVMTVLFDTAKKISDLLREFAEAAVELNHDVWQIYFTAVKQAIKDLDPRHFDLGDVKDGVKKVGHFLKGLAKGTAEVAADITLNIDTAALNHVVERYNSKVNALTPQFDALGAGLDEAYRQAPSYAAEEARAEAFGARSLNDFKNEHKYTKDDDEKNHFYPLDLANDEGLYGGHSIDRHVGLTDEQLKARLRDDSSASSASAFKDLASAQRFTQAALDDVDNADRIEKWIERVKRRQQNNPGWDPNNSKIQPPIELSFTDATGSTVSGADYALHGNQAQVSDTHKVRVVLRYRDGLEPPFIVVTSMPVN